MTIAWLEVYVTDHDRRTGYATRLPLEWAEHPGGWLARLKSLALPARQGSSRWNGWVRDDPEDDLDGDDLDGDESAQLEVENVPRGSRRFRRGGPLPQTADSMAPWYSVPDRQPSSLRSTVAGNTYGPEPLPECLKGALSTDPFKPMIRSHHDLSTQLPGSVFHRVRHSHREDPNDLDELLAEFHDVEEEEMGKKHSKRYGEQPEDPQETIAAVTLDALDSEEQPNIPNVDELVDVTESQEIEGRTACRLLACLVMGKEVTVDDGGHHERKGKIIKWDTDDPTALTVSFLDGRLPEAVSIGIQHLKLSPVVTPLFFDSGELPHTDLDLAKPVPAPDHVNRVPETTPDEVAIQAARGIRALEDREREFERWKKDELPYLLEMVKQGYDPESGRLFRDLSKEKRVVLDEQLAKLSEKLASLAKKIKKGSA